MNQIRFIIVLTVSVIYLIAGLLAFITFLIFKNNVSSLYGALTAMLSGILTHIHILKYKNKLDEWYTVPNLKKIGMFGYFWFALCFPTMVYFLVMQIMTKKPLMPISESLVLPIIWSFMASKSGIVLWMYADSCATAHADRN